MYTRNRMVPISIVFDAFLELIKPLRKNAEGLFLGGLVQYIVFTHFMSKTHTTGKCCGRLLSRGA
jgi:hypothetical protein